MGKPAGAVGSSAVQVACCWSSPSGSVSSSGNPVCVFRDRGPDQEVCFEGTPLIWNVVPTQRTRLQPATCCRAPLPSSPSPGLRGGQKSVPIPVKQLHQASCVVSSRYPLSIRSPRSNGNPPPQCTFPHAGNVCVIGAAPASHLCAIWTPNSLILGHFLSKICSSGNTSQTLMT